MSTTGDSTGAGEPPGHVEAALLTEVDVHQRDVRLERARQLNASAHDDDAHDHRDPLALEQRARRGEESPRCRRLSVSAVPLA